MIGSSIFRVREMLTNILCTLHRVMLYNLYNFSIILISSATTSTRTTIDLQNLNPSVREEWSSIGVFPAFLSVDFSTKCYNPMEMILSILQTILLSIIGRNVKINENSGQRLIFQKECHYSSDLSNKNLWIPWNTEIERKISDKCISPLASWSSRISSLSPQDSDQILDT